MNTEIKRNRYYRSLMRNVVIAILLTAITPTVVVSIFILDAFRVSYKEKVYDHLDVLTRKHKRSIDIFLEEKLMDIRLLAKTNRFEELTNEVILNQKFNELQRAFDRSFVDYGHCRPSGTSNRLCRAVRINRGGLFQCKMVSAGHQQVHFSSVTCSKECVVHPILSYRCDKNHGGKPWILRATIDFGEFNSLVEFLRIGETGFAFILNTAGQFQTKPIANVNSR
jgi:two-component system NtrC family sensor kinase